MKILRNKSLLKSGICLANVLCSVALVGASYLICRSGTGSSRSDRAALHAENVRASEIILEKIEAIRRCSWKQINSNGFIRSRFTEQFASPMGASPRRSRTVASEDPVTYYGTISISNSPAAGLYHADIKELTVALNWSHSNRPRTYYLKTLLSANSATSAKRMPEHL